MGVANEVGVVKAELATEPREPNRALVAAQAPPSLDSGL